MSHENEYSILQNRINEIKCYEHDELSKVYYSSRDIINSPEKYNNIALDPGLNMFENPNWAQRGQSR